MDLDERIDSAVHRDISFLDENMRHLLEWIKLSQAKIKAHPETGRWYIRMPT